MSVPMFDLTYAQDADGTIRLEQRDYCGESSIIDLHPAQLRHIAESAGLLVPAAPGNCSTLERRFRIVAGQLAEFALDDVYRTEILERCADGLYYLTKLDAVVTLADEFLTDLGITGQNQSIPADGGCDEMPNLRIERDDDGTIYLCQTQLSGMGGSDEEIELHPVQARWLAAQLLGAVGQKTTTTKKTNDAEGLSNGNSRINTVTASEAPKRGRPATGIAMSNAERQKAHRARQAVAAETLPLALDCAP